MDASCMHAANRARTCKAGRAQGLTTLRIWEPLLPNHNSRESRGQPRWRIEIKVHKVTISKTRVVSQYEPDGRGAGNGEQMSW